MARAAIALCLVLVGCASGGSSPSHEKPQSICPDNPTYCAGTCCGSLCVDTTSDSRNCGACDVVCSVGTSCVSAACGCPPTGSSCGQGQSCCGDNGCKSLNSDINNCGGCGIVCNGSCTAGTCSGSTVDAGSTADMASPVSGSCTCTSTCLLGCGGNNCCLEAALAGSCTPNPNCP